MNTQYIIYCRKSTTDEEKQTQSIPDQIKYCMQYATTNNLSLMSRPKDFSNFETTKDIVQYNMADPYEKEIYDNASKYFVVTETQTAKIPGKRSKWTKIISMIEKWEIQGIISYSPDRQARNIVEWWVLINLVDENKVSLKYTNFHFENTASGKMMLGVWFVFAKQYSDGISENVNRWIKESLERGKSIWHTKHGYRRREDGYYEPDHNWNLLYEAFQMKIYDDKNDKTIIKRLNNNWFHYHYGKNNRKTVMDKNKISKVRQDPFYYWLLIHGENQSDQIETNPHYKPMITREEFELINSRNLEKRGWLEYEESITENRYIDILPKGLIHWENWYLLSFGIPNKKRYRNKLEELQKENPSLQLQDIIQPHQIIYSVNTRTHKDYGTSIRWDELISWIAFIFSQLTINKEEYEKYIDDMYNETKTRNKERWNLIAQHTRSIQHYEEKLTDYIRNNRHLRNGDKVEQDVYIKDKVGIESMIESWKIEKSKLEKENSNEIVEFEIFSNIFTNLHKFYIEADYVRKKKITELIFSNIIVTKEKELKLEVKPVFKNLFEWFFPTGAEYGIRTRDLDLGKVAL